jgi:hypothetical protein
LVAQREEQAQRSANLVIGNNTLNTREGGAQKVLMKKNQIFLVKSRRKQEKSFLFAFDLQELALGSQIRSLQRI